MAGDLGFHTFLIGTVQQIGRRFPNQCEARDRRRIFDLRTRAERNHERECDNCELKKSLRKENTRGESAFDRHRQFAIAMRWAPKNATRVV
jgi:hypothetical protein